jgi:hypothetical protein
MDDLQEGDLTIQAAFASAGDVLDLHWTGRSTNRDPSRFLGPYFSVGLSAAKASGKVLALHFEKLEQLNTATLRAVVQLVRDARERGVRLRILFDASVKWQKLSFDALRALSGDGELELISTLP